MRQKQGFRRNSRNSAPIVLPEHREVQLGEGVATGDSALRQNSAARAAHEGFVAPEAGKLASEIGFYRGADVGRSARVDRPVPFLMLFASDVSSEFLEFFSVAKTEELKQKDVLALKNRVAFKLRHPITFRMLLLDKISLRRTNGVPHSIRRDGGLTDAAEKSWIDYCFV